MPGLSADLAHFEVVEFHLIEEEGPDLLAVDRSFLIQDLLVRQDLIVEHVHAEIAGIDLGISRMIELPVEILELIEVI